MPRYFQAAIIRFAKPLFAGAMVLAFVMAVLPHPPQFFGSPSDKVQHVAAFFVLGVLGALSFSQQSKLRLIIGLALFGAAIELVQATPALHRDSDIIDLATDVMAATVAVWLTRMIAPPRNP